MNSILLILLWIALGMCAGVWGKNNARLLRVADKVALLAVYGLLFLLGAGLGADSALWAKLPRLGGTALCIALFSVAGSVLCLSLARKFIFFPPALAGREGTGDACGQGAQEDASPLPAGAHPAGHVPFPLWGTVRILAFFTAGVACSQGGLVPVWLLGGALTSYALYLLVFAVGVGLGADLKAFGIVRVMRLRILAVPLLIIVGTFAGAAAAWAVLPGFSLRDALSVGAGFGYYSLSSLLIEESGHASLASIALLSNIFREIAGLLSAPLLVRLYGPLAPVAAAGATAMDTCLPVIARFSGERYAVIAVFSGMVLTLAVPFLVTALLHW